MKTINFKEKSRSDRMRNILLRSGAVVIIVILLGFTVSAQGLWKQILMFNSYGKMAVLMVRGSETGSRGEKVASGSDNPASSGTVTFQIEPALDEGPGIGAWMTDDDYFGAYNGLFEDEPDKPLELEPWMTDDRYFTSRFATDQDSALAIEVWMIDDRYWRY
ncbi:MAG: hypothetical protein PHI28_03895 [Mangrovibacterium sp.]|nr:hypothetical protein [Mangrovibacterium sp.]